MHPLQYKEQYYNDTNVKVSCYWVYMYPNNSYVLVYTNAVKRQLISCNQVI